MSRHSTPFRPLARMGWGGKAATHWRGLLTGFNDTMGPPSVDPQVIGPDWRSQIGTVVYRSPGVRQNYSIAGVTKDSTGATLGLCRVELYLTGSDLPVATLTSTEAGLFSFDNPGSGPFYIVAYKAGSPDVAGTTVNTLVTAPWAPSLDFNFTLGVLPAGMTFTRASSGTRINASGVLVTETADVARFDYSPTSVGTLLGLLIEPARTNLVANSAAPFSTYTADGVTVTADQIAAPDGNTAADKVADTAANANHRGYDVHVGALGQVTLSMYAKPSSATMLQLLEYDGNVATSYYANFDVNTGALGNKEAGAISVITPAGGGYYRVSVTTPAGVPSTNSQISLINNTDTASALPSYAGSLQFMYWWGAQREEGASATSLIPTSGSTATRAADALSFAIPNWVSTLRYTFDDNTTQDVGVSPGAYTVPTNLNRARIKRIVGS